MRVFGLWLALFLISGCNDARQFAGECTAPEECPTGSTCRIDRGTSVGICICKTDEACGEGEICNTQGVCQKRAGCRSSADCEDRSTFCDIGSGACLSLPRSECGSFTHCAFGSVCDFAAGACVDGCHTSGDCALNSACDRTGLTSPQQLGQCLRGRCGDKSFCAYGEQCVAGTCTRDPNMLHCQACQAGNLPCGSPNNFCLVNSSYDPSLPQNGGPNFCGVECQSDAQCPNGYDCGGVVLLTQDQCTNSAECGGGGRQCALGEGQLRGFCTCVSDADCSFEEIPPLCAGSCAGLGIRACLADTDCLAGRCDMSVRICQNPSGQRCGTDADCAPLPLCGPYAGAGNVCINSPNPAAPTPCGQNSDCLCQGGRCANTGRSCASGADCNPPCQGGGCVLGAACAPTEGLLCPDVR